MKLTNQKMCEMITALEPLLERTDILGYLAARNTKLLSEATAEYEEFKNSLVIKYGKPDLDDDGNELPTVSICPGYDGWEKYVKEMESIMNVEQEFTPVTTSYEDAIGVLSGKELLNLDWMFHD